MDSSTYFFIAYKNDRVARTINIQNLRILYENHLNVDDLLESHMAIPKIH